MSLDLLVIISEWKTAGISKDSCWEKLRKDFFSVKTSRTLVELVGWFWDITLLSSYLFWGKNRSSSWLYGRNFFSKSCWRRAGIFEAARLWSQWMFFRPQTFQDQSNIQSDFKYACKSRKNRSSSVNLLNVSTGIFDCVKVCDEVSLLLISMTLLFFTKLLILAAVIQ